MNTNEKSEKELLEEISEKLNKLIGIFSMQNEKLDTDSKIKILKNCGFESSEIGPFVGLSDSSVRGRKGWKGK